MTTATVSTLNIQDLFDHLQRTLGVPAFGEGNGEPFWKWRLRQVSLLRKKMAQNRLTTDDVLLCAEYCQAHKERALTFDGLFRHYYDAVRWRKQLESPEHLEQEIAEAIAYERALAGGEDTIWSVRLIRAHPSRRREVYEEWRSQQ